MKSDSGGMRKGYPAAEESGEPEARHYLVAIATHGSLV